MCSGTSERCGELAKDAGVTLLGETKKGTAKVKEELKMKSKAQAKPMRRRTYPVFAWGTNINVKPCADGLEVEAIVPISEQDLQAASDVYRAYRMASHDWRQKRTGKNSPHMQFANADTDEKLTRFVERFGPLVVSSLTTKEHVIHPDSDDPFDLERTRTILIARQNLDELRNERLLYRSALTLVSELERGEGADITTVRQCICDVAERASDWPNQWQREQRLRSSGQGYECRPLWLFGHDNLRRLDRCKWLASRQRSSDPIRAALGAKPQPIRAGHLAICELVNACPPLVYLWGEQAVEGLHWDLTCGIRPALYYMLRREYLEASGIAVCGNKDCRELFEIERADQQFCSELCSRHQRQREYWEKIGKKLRQRRNKIRKSAGARQLGRTSVSEKDLTPPVRD